MLFPLLYTQFAEVAGSDNHVDDYLAEFFSNGETEDVSGMQCVGVCMCIIIIHLSYKQTVVEEHKGVDNTYFEFFDQDTASESDVRYNINLLCM